MGQFQQLKFPENFCMALMNVWAYASPIDNSYGPIRKKFAFLMPSMGGNAGKDAINAF
jgi:hypothetical protein